MPEPTVEVTGSFPHPRSRTDLTVPASYSVVSLLSRAMCCLTCVLVSATSVAAAGAAESAAGRSRSHPLSASTKACFKAATTAARTTAMPKPTRLVKPLSVQWDGTIEFAPPQLPLPDVVNPSSIWKSFTGTQAGSKSRLFLAYFTASIPATLEPGGILKPYSDHVLSWVLLTQHDPFDTAGISVLPATKEPRVTCTFTGETITAWNALTGAALAGGGFRVPSHPVTIRPAVKPYVIR
jgi:hypothetical protein